MNGADLREGVVGREYLGGRSEGGRIDVCHFGELEKERQYW